MITDRHDPNFFGFLQMKLWEMTDKPYSVPVIPPDLRREETIQQICDALAYLDQVSSDIFTRLGQRMAESQARLRAVSGRMQLAQAKIDSLKGSKKATRVFSSAKYPAGNDEEQYVSVHGRPEEHLRHVRRGGPRPQSRHPPAVDDTTLREKLQFYNVQLRRKRSKEEGEGEGLGRLPAGIESLDALLLFNTSENP